MLNLLGVISAENILEQNRDRLIGMHLHDAIGRRDHLPPGQGEINFQTLLPYLNPGVLKVMELRPGTPIKDAAQGLTYLRTIIPET
jgi:sugar phosphate isomerase/epimerase